MVSANHQLFGTWRLALAVFAIFCLSTCAAGAEPATVTVQTRNPGALISERALGLSYETSLMLPDTNGVRYFRPDNRPLVRMFHTLGIKSLRIGGNSVDAARIPIPTDDDIHSLFKFARVAGVKVIYSVRLEDGDPASAARQAKLIGARYADTLDLFAIGNEPKEYYKDTNVYLAKWSAIRDAMVSAWPAAKFCGPDDNSSPERCRMVAGNFGAPKGPLVEISQHSYSFGCSYRNPGEKDVAKLVPVDVEAAREKMLAPQAYGIYEKIYDGIRSSLEGTPLSFRLSEVNSFWYSGLKGVSDSYASALWGLDYLHWWASHGADGLNFHTGDRTGGAISLPCRYAAFVTSSNGYEARPLSYGLKLFSLGGHGRSLPAHVVCETNENLAAYATVDERTIYVTLINKRHGSIATNLPVQINLDSVLSRKSASVVFLTAKDNDIASGSGEVTLGGATIRADGTWSGKWTKLNAASGAKSIDVSMPPASAAVVKFNVR